jgi:hypothetical protein
VISMINKKQCLHYVLVPSFYHLEALGYFFFRLYVSFE